MKQRIMIVDDDASIRDTFEHHLTRSGYEGIRAVGGPDSVNSALRRHDALKESYFRVHGLQHLLDPYSLFKAAVNFIPEARSASMCGV